MARLDGKSLIVTGAARGIGAEIARRCAAEGARTVLVDVDEGGAMLAAELGPDAVFHQADVTIQTGWDAVVALAVERFGGIDVLVNNAAIYRRAAMPDVSDENFEEHYRVNVFGAFLGMRACAAPMIERGGGSIVNIASVAGMDAGPGLFSYAVSKWAMRGLTKAASADLAPRGIRVNTVIPGLIESALSESNPPGYNDGFIEQTPLRRIGQQEDVAAGVVFLASDESSFMTGTDLVIDGGLVG
jgi:3alpha(or 20beta)-hydroxysteroid dehydrogenase